MKTDDFGKYEQLCLAGKNPREVYSTARLDGVDNITAIRMLRQVFGLSIIDAKKTVQSRSVFESSQEVRVGGQVYWEGSDSIDGQWMMHARVREIRDGYAFVCDHKKYLVHPDGLAQVPAVAALESIPLKYFEKPLVERLNQSFDFWKQLAEINHVHA